MYSDNDSVLDMAFLSVIMVEEECEQRACSEVTLRVNNVFFALRQKFTTHFTTAVFQFISTGYFVSMSTRDLSANKKVLHANNFKWCILTNNATTRA